MIKRMAALLVAALMLMTVLPTAVSADAVEITADNINSSRGAGELVIYTADYGDTTGTNFWGAEAIVDENHVVTHIGNGNSEIPADGFVLSGHDDESDGGARMKAWISDNIAVGDYVYVDKRSLKVTVSDTPLTIEESLFYEVGHAIDGVNVSRDTDFLVMYTPLHGDFTNTNAYGYEVTVANGMVTAIGGNNSAIPQDGFVISGHGDMADWLRANIISGMRAAYDQAADEVRFVYDAEGIMFSVTLALEQLQDAVDEAKKQYMYADYAASEAVLADVQSRYDAALTAFENDGKERPFVEACEAALADLSAAQNALCESYTVQYRGVWVRPSQLSAAAVEEYVQRLYLSGINTVSVEGWFENGVIMEVPEDCLYEKNPRFRFDVLQAYIDACHKYGMECHLWMPIMCVGSTVDSGYDRSVTAKKPEWLSLSQHGTPDNDNGFMMIDPANKEAREYLVSFYEYIVTHYDIDCFELDYIRYYTADGDLDFGYTDAAFEGFEAAYGHGVTPTYDPDAAYWDDWCDYRRECVTEMVRAVRTMLDRAAPDILLSADVNPTRTSACDLNYQDYPAWMAEGLLDILHQMAYGDGYGEAITDAVMLGGDRTLVVTGLGVYTDSLGASQMERQARENNDYGNYGDFYFEAQTYLSDKVYTLASDSVYRHQALAPFRDPDRSVTECLSYMQGRVDDILLPMGGVTAQEAATLTDAITAAKNAVADAVIGSEALSALQTAINAVTDPYAVAALKDDLYRATVIGSVKHATDYVAETDPPATATTAPTTDDHDKTDPTTVLIIVIAAVVAILGGAFGVWKLFVSKKSST